MDYLKSRAPFWKKEVTAAGAAWVEARAEDEDALSRWARLRLSRAQPWPDALRLDVAAQFLCLVSRLAQPVHPRAQLRLGLAQTAPSIPPRAAAGRRWPDPAFPRLRAAPWPARPSHPDRTLETWLKARQQPVRQPSQHEGDEEDDGDGKDEFPAGSWHLLLFGRSRGGFDDTVGTLHRVGFGPGRGRAGRPA